MCYIRIDKTFISSIGISRGSLICGQGIWPSWAVEIMQDARPMLLDSTLKVRP